jgi:hypothetical protein
LSALLVDRIINCAVIAGLDPAIHVLTSEHKPKKDVDARHNAGHDGAGKF